MGRRSLRERCLKPIVDINELKLRQNRISSLRLDDRTIYEHTLKGCADLPRLFRRFQLGKGTTADLIQLCTTYEKAQILITLTKGKLYEADDVENLQKHIQSLLSRWDADRIRKSRDQLPNDSIALGSSHPWCRGYHAELDRMEDAWHILESEILSMKQSWENLIEEENSISWSIKDDAPFTFTTTARRASSLSALSKQLKVDITFSKRGSSTIVTLESEKLEKANLKGKEIRQQWMNMVVQQWNTDWTEWMTTEIENGMLETLVEFIGRFDAECTFARISDLYGYVKPTYVESTEESVAGFLVKELRHPIIERIHTDTPYISHNLAVGAFSDLDFVSMR